MKKYCLNCMREITTGTLCSDCVGKKIPETVPHQLKPGTILNGKYLVGNVIGEGGFGSPTSGVIPYWKPRLQLRNFILLDALIEIMKFPVT